MKRKNLLRRNILNRMIKQEKKTKQEDRKHKLEVCATEDAETREKNYMK